MCLRWNKQEKYLSTLVKITKSQWNGKKMEVINHPESIQYNLLLNKLKSKANSYFLDKTLSEQPFNLVDLVNYLKGAKDGNFIDFIRQNLANNGKLAPSTLKQHRVLLKYLEKFKKSLNFSELDYNFPSKFESFLLIQPSYRDKTKTLNSNYVATMLTILKKYCKIGVVQDRLKQDPFYGFVIKRRKTVKIELTIEQIHSIMKMNVSRRRGKVGVSRDAFIFSCFTGLRYSDLFGSKRGTNYGLRVKHFLPTPDGYRLQKTTQKTGSALDIPLYLLPFDGIPQKIAEKYLKGKGQNDYVFGILDLNSYNNNIRSVAKAAGIETDFSSHTARHSFSTLMQEKKIPLKVISALVGHSSVKTTEVYAKTNSTAIDNILRSKL